MKSYRKELHFHLPTRRGLVNITREVQKAVTESGVKEGLVAGQRHEHYRQRVHQ